ncbi:MAG: sugar transferase [Deferrisomatales bacterium]
MFREHAKVVERVVMVADLVLVGASLAAANLVLGNQVPYSFFQRHGFFVLASGLVWFALLRHTGLYRSLRTRKLNSILQGIVQITAMAGVLNAAVLFLTSPHFSRRLYALHLALAFGFLLAWRVLIFLAQRVVRRRGYNYRRVLVVGTQEQARRFIEHVEEHRGWGFQIVGCVLGRGEPPEPSCCAYPVLGRVEQLVEICMQETVDEVVFTLPRQHLGEVEGMLDRLGAIGVTVRLTLDYYRPRQSRTMFGFLGDDDPIPVVTYYRMTLDPTQLFLKRLLDVVGGAVGLAFTALALPFVAYAIRRDDPGPIFFRQRRVGQNGRIFNLYKFRTMAVDAEKRKQELMARNEMKGAMFKIADDPRITRVGKFLRKTSLDELPQFWNVLKGEMSLVGTRPPTPDEVAEYHEWQRARISIKPGLTGMWQTSGRNRVDDFEKVCHLDLAYIDNWSLGLDLKLLAKTVGVVVLGAGAR